MFFTCTRAWQVWKELGVKEEVEVALYADGSGAIVLEELLKKRPSNNLMPRSSHTRASSKYRLVYLVGEKASNTWRGAPGDQTICDVT